MLHTKSKIVSSKIKSKQEDYIFTSVHAKELSSHRIEGGTI